MSARGLTPWTLRMGNAQWPRLTGERASSAKSVFHFGVQGSGRGLIVREDLNKQQDNDSISKEYTGLCPSIYVYYL